jgi:O-acetylserine/cysteine efflux transporter
VTATSVATARPEAQPLAAPASGSSSEFVVLVVSTLVWGSLHPTAKFAMQQVTPLEMSVLRPVCACVILTLLVLLQGNVRRVLLEARRAPRTLFALGLLGFAGSSVLATLALDRLPAGITSLVANASPLMVVLGGIVMFRHHVQPLVIVGTVTGFAGVALLGLASVSPSEGASATLIGVLLALAASASWAAYTGLARRLGSADPIATTALTAGIGALLVSLIAVPTQDWSRVATAPLSTVLAILWAGAVATGLTYAAWSFALRRLPAIVVAPFGYLIPVSALTISHFWLGEPITAAVIVGALMVVAGVALTQLEPLGALWSVARSMHRSMS